MITLISTPQYADPVNPAIISRWLATESPNNFRLLRQDFLINSYSNNAGKLNLNITAYTGSINSSVAVYDLTTKLMYSGKITNISGTEISTDITYVAGMNIESYLNDYTLYGGYHFEGRLTVNGIIEAFTIFASPDSFGYADLDVSVILKIKTSIGKNGDYTSTLMSEVNKSGRFTFQYRARYYGDNYDAVLSPPIGQGWIAEGETWHYAESVRSEEQGSNLHEYVATSIYDAPFFNQFEQPVYFKDQPFDVSFILPDFEILSPSSSLTVTKKIYNSAKIQLGPDIVTYVEVGSHEGFLNSVTIDSMPDGAEEFTIEITD